MAKTDYLTAEKLRELVRYDQETGVFTWLVETKTRRIGEVVGRPSPDGYLQCCLLGKTRLLHRLAWLYMTGDWPKGQIDHKHGVKTDNRFCELRDVDQSLNLQNRRGPYKNNKSGCLGVYYDKKQSRYRSTIRINGKKVHLGWFKSCDDAQSAYMEGKRALHPGMIDGLG